MRSRKVDISRRQIFRGLVLPNTCKLWILLPVKDEASNLRSLLPRIRAALHPFGGLQYEVVVVDDGSRDTTAEFAASFRFQMPVVVLPREGEPGMGSALRTGISHIARNADEKDWLAILDGDGTHPPELLPKIFSEAQPQRKIAIASRYVPKATVLGIAWHRRLLSLAANQYFRRRYPIEGVRDYTSRYRLYPIETVKRAQALAHRPIPSANGFEATTELLYRLARTGAEFLEVPAHLASYEPSRPGRRDFWGASLRLRRLIPELN